MPARTAQRSFLVSSFNSGPPDSAVSDAAAPGDFLIGRSAPPIRMPIHRRVPPRRWSSTPFILLGVFLLLNLTGGVLLCLPLAAADGNATNLQTGFFTAISAATVTGLALVDTQTHWSLFGQVIIFLLMLIGGLGVHHRRHRADCPDGTPRQRP